MQNIGQVEVPVHTLLMVLITRATLTHLYDVVTEPTVLLVIVVIVIIIVVIIIIIIIILIITIITIINDYVIIISA